MFKKSLQLIFLACLNFSVQAADLSASQIKQWVSAAPMVSQWLGSNSDILGESSGLDFLNGSPLEIATSAITQLKNSDLYPQFSALLQKYGYGSVENFFVEHSQIIQAYVAYQAQSSSAVSDMKNSLSGAMSDLKKSSSLSDDQKDKLSSQVSGLLGQVEEKTNTDNPNISAITPYVSQIGNALKLFGK